MTTQQTLLELNNQLAISDHLKFITGPGDMLMLEISNDQAQARIALQGAQLLSWQPKGQQPVIWLSEDAGYVSGKAVRGGIPVCWPWFGAHPDRHDLPAHGFARTTVWKVADTGVTDSGQSWITFSLPEEEKYSDLLSAGIELEFYISVGTTLEMKLITRNRGSGRATVSQALHTYFAISDISKIAVKGLEQCEFIDTLDNRERKVEAEPVKINAEIDRIYQGTNSSYLIEDSGLQRQIRINTQGSQSAVVWNPWIEKSLRLSDMGENGYLKMLCVESANIENDVINLDAGEEHGLSVSYSINSL